MTPKQIELVQSTFQAVVPVAAETADIFYDRLFFLDPSLRPMFKGDLKSQKQKLLSALVMVVKNLHQPEVILGPVQKLGRGHVGYGVQSYHYDLVGAALLYALEQQLADVFTMQVKEAWAAAYMLLSDVMKAAAAEVQPQPGPQPV